MKKSYGKHIRARLGQHFLSDARVRDRIVASLDPKPDDQIVEIGAGRGFLTEALGPRVKKLWAIELDSRWVLTLKAAFLGSRKVEVVEGDILEINFQNLCGSASTGQLRVVGNLPYYITSPILFRLFEQAHLIRDAVLMMQGEVAERITASPTSKDYGYASLATQLFSRAEVLFSIPPTAFSPAPQVHSSVVRLHMSPRTVELGIEDVSHFLPFAQGIFQEKRKTLLNNLKRMIPLPDDAARLRLQQAMVECALEPTVRAENLPVEMTAHLYRCLRQRGFL